MGKERQNPRPCGNPSSPFPACLSLSDLTHPGTRTSVASCRSLAVLTPSSSCLFPLPYWAPALLSLGLQSLRDRKTFYMIKSLSNMELRGKGGTLHTGASHPLAEFPHPLTGLTCDPSVYSVWSSVPASSSSDPHTPASCSNSAAPFLSTKG